MAKKFKIECYILKIEEHHDFYDSSQIERLLNEGWKVKNFCACAKPSYNNHIVVYLERKVKVEGHQPPRINTSRLDFPETG